MMLNCTHSYGDKNTTPMGICIFTCRIRNAKGRTVSNRLDRCLVEIASMKFRIILACRQLVVTFELGGPTQSGRGVHGDCKLLMLGCDNGFRRNITQGKRMEWG